MVRQFVPRTKITIDLSLEYAVLEIQSKDIASPIYVAHRFIQNGSTRAAVFVCMGGAKHKARGSRPQSILLEIGDLQIPINFTY